MQAPEGDESFRHPSSHPIARRSVEVWSFLPKTLADGDGRERQQRQHVVREPSWDEATIRVAGLPGIDDGVYMFEALQPSFAVFRSRDGAGSLELRVPEPPTACSVGVEKGGTPKSDRTTRASHGSVFDFLIASLWATLQWSLVAVAVASFAALLAHIVALDVTAKAGTVAHSRAPELTLPASELTTPWQGEAQRMLGSTATAPPSIAAEATRIAADPVPQPSARPEPASPVEGASVSEERLRVRARVRRSETTAAEDGKGGAATDSGEGSALDCSPTDALPVGTKLAVYPMDISTSTGTTDVATAYVEVFSETRSVYMTYRDRFFHCGYARQLGLSENVAVGMQDHNVFRADAFW